MRFKDGGQGGCVTTTKRESSLTWAMFAGHPLRPASHVVHRPVKKPGSGGRGAERSLTTREAGRDMVGVGGSHAARASKHAKAETDNINRIITRYMDVQRRVESMKRIGMGAD